MLRFRDKDIGEITIDDSKFTEVWINISDINVCQFADIINKLPVFDSLVRRKGEVYIILSKEKVEQLNGFELGIKWFK